MTFREIIGAEINPLARIALSIDLEDFYHANYPGYNYRTMAGSPSRLIEPTEIMLEIFDRYLHKVTFFVLGEVARRFPELIRKISESGHEIASHGENHTLIFEQSRDKSIHGIRNSIYYLEDITGNKIYGFRAPNFSASPKRTPWLFDELADLGLTYDSSRFPAKTYYGGEPGIPKTPFIMELPGGGRLWEVPVSCIGPRGLRFAWSGGFYWRIIPLSFIAKRANKLLSQNKPVVLYLHPKDIDAENPPLPIGRISNWIHQVGTKRGFAKLDEMASQLQLCRIIDLLPEIKNGKEQQNKKRARETETAVV